MELKRALSIYYMGQEILQMQKDLQTVEELANSRQATDYMNAIEYTGMPKAKSYKKEAPFEQEVIRKADSIIRLKTQLEKKKAEYLELKEEFERFMESIEDPKTRMIIRWRCMEQKRWETIGEAMHMDRRTASRTFYKQFDLKQKKCPQCPPK